MSGDGELDPVKRARAALDKLNYLEEEGAPVSEQPKSTSVLSVDAPQGGPRPARPWDRNDLLRRLRTFSSARWFAKPVPSCSPMTCARKGWHCTGVSRTMTGGKKKKRLFLFVFVLSLSPRHSCKRRDLFFLLHLLLYLRSGLDTIECESCLARLKLELPATLSFDEVNALAVNFSARLDMAHDDTCAWRGKRCRLQLATFPPVERQILHKDFFARFEGLCSAGSLPPITSGALAKIDSSHHVSVTALLTRGPGPLGGSSQINALFDDDSLLVNSSNPCVSATMSASIPPRSEPDSTGKGELASLANKRGGIVNRARLLALCGWRLDEPSLPQVHLCCDTCGARVATKVLGHKSEVPRRGPLRPSDGALGMMTTSNIHTPLSTVADTLVENNNTVAVASTTHHSLSPPPHTPSPPIQLAHLSQTIAGGAPVGQPPSPSPRGGGYSIGRLNPGALFGSFVPTFSPRTPCSRSTAWSGNTKRSEEGKQNTNTSSHHGNQAEIGTSSGLGVTVSPCLPRALVSTGVKRGREEEEEEEGWGGRAGTTGIEAPRSMRKQKIREEEGKGNVDDDDERFGFDPLSSHRNFCPWVVFPGFEEGGIPMAVRVGWTWYLETLVGRTVGQIHGPETIEGGDRGHGAAPGSQGDGEDGDAARVQSVIKSLRSAT